MAISSVRYNDPRVATIRVRGSKMITDSAPPWFQLNQCRMSQFPTLRASKGAASPGGVHWVEDGAPHPTLDSDASYATLL